MDANERGMFTRRRVLTGGAAVVASAGLPLPSGLGRHAADAPEPDRRTRRWGRIANDSRRGDPVMTGLYFCGPLNQFTTTSLFTRHPLNGDRLDWSGRSDIEYAMRRFRSTGLNVLTFSYWGHEDHRTDRSGTHWMFSNARWPGDPPVGGEYTEAEQIAKAREMFDVASDTGLLLTPLLEVHFEHFPFFAQFPRVLDELVERSVWLVRNFGDEPNFLRLYNKDGEKRLALTLIETITIFDIDPNEFAAGFDDAARLVEQQTGHKVGFCIDPTALPKDGPHLGPDHPAALRQRPSILAIKPFNITSQGPVPTERDTDLTEEDRLTYCRNQMSMWSGSGIPFIAPVNPGYDASKLPEPKAVYGHSAQWRQRQQELAVEFATAGLSFDTYNGFTEGQSILPTEEDGDAVTTWACDTVRAVRHRLDRRR
jgi:hypothetical protein